MFDSSTLLQLFFGNNQIIDNRDVALLDFEESLQQAGKQSWLYSLLTNMLLGGVTLFGSFMTFKNSSFLQKFSEDKIWLLIVVLVVLYLILLSFTELQKTINLNMRKVIVLRKMLGLDYSAYHYVLPRFRFEGATNPFVAKLFPGWLTYTAFPFWFISIFVLVFTRFLLEKRDFGGLFGKGITISFLQLTDFIIPWWFFASIFVVAFFAFRFRGKLFEEHETYRLRITYLISKMLSIKLDEDFMYVVFRAKLAVSEIKRLKINVEDLREVLIELEDKRFEKHHGVDYRALVRAICSQVPIISQKIKLTKSGGSTISMQLVRTLFVKEYQKTKRRKIIELLLAPWIEGQFSKDQIFYLYIASVRFHEKTNGLPAVMSKFWGTVKKGKAISYPEAFVLVERLSNRGNGIRLQKIKAQMEQLKKNIMLNENFDKEVEKIYQNLVLIKVLSWNDSNPLKITS